jgi:hypothetical protein
MNRSSGTGVLSDKRMHILICSHILTHTPQVRDEGWQSKKKRQEQQKKHTHNVPQQLPQPTTNFQPGTQ